MMGIQVNCNWKIKRGRRLVIDFEHTGIGNTGYADLKEKSVTSSVSQRHIPRLRLKNHLTHVTCEVISDTVPKRGCGYHGKLYYYQLLGLRWFTGYGRHS